MGTHLIVLRKSFPSRQSLDIFQRSLHPCALDEGSLSIVRVNMYFHCLPIISIIMCYKAGFDFPRGPGAYAPRFCCGPLDFSDMGPKIVCILTRNLVFDHNILSKDLFGPLALNLSVRPCKVWENHFFTHLVAWRSM